MTESEYLPTSKFTNDELLVPGFLWHKGIPVALVKKHYRTQLLLPFEFLKDIHTIQLLLTAFWSSPVL